MNDYIDLTDEAIAFKIQNGDLASFGTLVERYEAKISRYARKFLFDHDDVNDLVKEVFIKAYINIQSFNVKRKRMGFPVRKWKLRWLNTKRRLFRKDYKI